MSGEPVLAIQPRRLGDLILSFPLFFRLRALFPGNPLLVCAEPQFYRELARFLPQASFLPPSGLDALKSTPLAAAINLSPRPDVSRFAGQCQAPLKIGPCSSGNVMRVNGFWQLYRMALTRNNQHNAMHWADLDFLDLYSALPLPESQYIPPKPAGKGIVGLFIGASEPAKRPDPIFWARLARRLAREGYKPLVMGGKAEISPGAEVSAHCGPGHVNLCGKLGLGQLAATLQTLDLLITPDTGPMHLANLVGAPVLNLSMGNVNAAETGPASPGQWILRAKMSCAGCWQCERPKLYCKASFNPLGVANAALAILAGKRAEEIAANVPPNLELLRTGKDESGLASLIPATASAHSARLALDDFWRAAFLSFAFKNRGEQFSRAALCLRHNHLPLAESLNKNLGKMLAVFNSSFAKGRPLPENFWRLQPRHCRLFAGHAQMALQNADYSRQAWLSAMDRAAALASSLAA